MKAVKFACALASITVLPALAAAQSGKPGTQRARPVGAPKPATDVAQTAKALSARVMPQGFSVVLVVADLQATATQDDVPPAARKALMDMKDFLPYKSYRLLDAAWLLGQSTSGNVTRLRGLDEQEYELRLFSQPASEPGDGSPRVFVRFTLNDSTTLDAHAEPVSAIVDHERRSTAELERQAAAGRARAELSRAQEEVAKKRRSLGGQHPETRAAEEGIKKLEVEAAARASERRAAATARQRAGNRPVIDTSFAMDIGETVVVGTSRLKGNGKALIALLTAVPSKGRM